ncbi:MAG: 5'/3'-nucleotidase SurE [Deltaproteobacteria bacterium]|nr:5'/3'-nucleotidase SurE [Deltaproteobacteria bacterium]MBW2018526.1 5'/3'-nucleotidase SurE [Deltaproteobacteria bacterium]MBW2073261.1 5'/3'-nucleotidase SurE [Deltaproteobacteria bacterium]RLB83357.1 MAG: 5'/3'-nucleotidase SurE [Deltaproteobacteria bacterium]
MNILLTNDDGIHAQGLWAMERVLACEHKVSVVAPDKERSAVGHSITLVNPLRVNRIQTNGGWGYAVNGTPADCVKLAVLELLETRPDMVISGINPGANVGINLNYSGTVSAAKEAALMGIPAIAVSQDQSPYHEYGAAAHFIGSLITKVMEKGLPSGTFLNVNIPACPPEKIRGVCITRQGISPLRENLHKRIDPRNQIYYWQGIETQVFDQEPDTDGAALCQNCISITPVQCDMTDYRTMEQLKHWDIGQS